LVSTEETRACCAWGRALHLPRKVATREDTRTLAEAVRDLIGINTLQGYPDPETRSADVILYKDKLSLLGFRDIRK
jgi:hypothetical protein